MSAIYAIKKLFIHNDISNDLHFKDLLFVVGKEKALEFIFFIYYIYYM